MLQDKLLIWKLRRGSTSALCLIYEKYRDDLLRVAAGLLKERSEAEDVVHDVFIAFVDVSGSFTLTGSIRGYLTTCVANKARNMNRTKFRQRTVSLDEAEPTVSNLKRPDQWIICDEEFQQLCNAMAQLPYEQREAVVLHLQGAMKFKEIAEIQETSVKTALSRYRYGLDKLRSILDGEVTK
ncbi:MAG: sigma-70 family RNA polymerase sigma factor [Planctomycetota bacterium]|nr:sigma-70 family RNA polymerase sigma factor [Planctomycetota bacterium]